MAKFCMNCGAELDENGKCQNCEKETANDYFFQPAGALDSDGIEPVLASTKQEIMQENTTELNIQPEMEAAGEIEVPKKKKSGKKIALWIAAACSVLVVSIVTLCVLVYFDKINIPFINDIYVNMGMKQETEAVSKEENSKAKQEAKTIDADEYFSNNAEIVEEFLALDSKEVRSESETLSDLADRGFTESPITTAYSMEGEYTKETEISEDSSEMHPVYTTYYVTPEGAIWIIVEINGGVYATPISYISENEDSVPIFVSETETVTSYDGNTGKFYVTIPDETTAKVLVVDKVDAETLDNLTDGELDEL